MFWHHDFAGVKALLRNVTQCCCCCWLDLVFLIFVKGFHTVDTVIFANLTYLRYCYRFSYICVCVSLWLISLLDFSPKFPWNFLLYYFNQMLFQSGYYFSYTKLHTHLLYSQFDHLHHTITLFTSKPYGIWLVWDFPEINDIFALIITVKLFYRN